MTTSPPELKNIQAILSLERETRERRSLLERVTDGVSDLASSHAFVVGHVVWFTVWILVNSFSRTPFDRYPFNLLTMAVSLEAIVLTSFVLMAQNRMTLQADKRAHLDLQVNLLAEQELTAILKVQCLLAERAGIDLSCVDPRIEELRSHTDVQRLAATIETEMAAPVEVAPCSSDNSAHE